MIDLKKYSSGVQHVGIPVSDIETTIRFYRNLGFSVDLITPNEAAGETVAFLSLGNLQFEFYGNRPTAKCAGAIDHVAIDVDNIEELYTAAIENGLTIIEPRLGSLPFWDNGIKYFTIVGPDNEKIEFCQKNKA